MLVVYIIAYSLSTVFYYLKHNYIASVIMISLAIFLYLKEIVFGLKGISDYFFINNDIANKLVLKFYLLIKFL